MKSKIIFLVLAVLLLTGCATKHNSKQHKQALSNNIQLATLKTGDEQLKAIYHAMQDNDLTDYVYDEDAIENGDVVSVSRYDHWNYATYFEIQELKKQIERGLSDLAHAKVDCEDSMIQLYIALFKKGYPADQLNWNYYLVPPSELTGVVQELGGHAVLIAEVEDDTPYSLEDLDAPRAVWEVEEQLGYYNVGFKVMNEDLAAPWHYTDMYGYLDLSENRVSIDVAKSTIAYKNRTAWTHTIYKRGENR